MIIFQFYTEEKDISLIFIFIMLTRVLLTSNIVTVQIITFPKKNLEKNIECKLPLHLSEIWWVYFCRHPKIIPESWLDNLRLIPVSIDLLTRIGSFIVTTKLRGHIHVFHWSYKLLIWYFQLDGPKLIWLVQIRQS